VADPAAKFAVVIVPVPLTFVAFVALVALVAVAALPVIEIGQVPDVPVPPSGAPPRLLKAVAAVVAFVPPFAIGSVPVIPVVNGKPVKLVATPDAGVPRTGAISAGPLLKTTRPVPVSSVNAPAKLALVGVPRNVATPAPSAVMPVPPLATGRVPVTPVVSGKPVALVKTAAVGVPSAGVVIVGEVNVLLVNVCVPVVVTTGIVAAVIAGKSKVDVKSTQVVPL